MDLLSDKISLDQQTSIKQLIENIRQDIKAENFESLKTVIDELKLAMKNMADENLSATDNMGDLNDL